MSFNIRVNGSDNFPSSISFHPLKEALLKKPDERTPEDLDIISQNIYDLKYFKDMVNSENERLEFARGCAKYLKYEYFAKGTEVIRKGDRGDNFYIILKGEVFVFIPKTEAEFQKDLTEEKQKVFEKYKEFMGTIEEFVEQNPILSQASSRVQSREGNRSKSFAFSSQSSFMSTPTPASKQESIARVLLAGNRIVRGEDAKHDFTFQEKLLFLNNKHVEPAYFNRGISTFKKVNYLRTGDSFGELALIFNQPRLASIIASEDLHLLSFTSNDYRDVFESEIQNVLKKIDFFNGIFPNLSQALIAKFCYLLEEKIFKFNDIIYKEGDEADGIYMIRQGEVQLSQIAKQKASESPRAANSKRGSIYQRKIIAATLVAGNFFGDIETLKNTRRNYTAISTSTSFVYRLKKQSYGIIERHFPAIASFLKSQAESTDESRKNRMEATKKIHLLALPTLDSLHPESSQKLTEEAKNVETKIKGMSGRKTEILPLHLKTRFDTITLREIDEEYHDQAAELGPIENIKTIERVQSLSRPSLFDFRESKIFALVSPRESRNEQPLLSPLLTPSTTKQFSEATMTPNHWFPSHIKGPKGALSSCVTPENKNLQHAGSMTSAHSTSKLNLPQLGLKRGSFSGIDVDKMPEFGFSSLVNRLRINPPASPSKQNIPTSPRNQTNMPISPKNQTNVPTSPRKTNMEEIPSLEHINTPKGSALSSSPKKTIETAFNKTLAKLIREKADPSNPGQGKSEKVNLHVRQKLSKLPFKHMKSPSPDKNGAKTTRETMLSTVSQGSQTERTINFHTHGIQFRKVNQPKKETAFKVSMPVIDMQQIRCVEHDNVVRNEILSAKSVDGKIKKTSHNMFRIFKNVVYK